MKRICILSVILSCLFACKKSTDQPETHQRQTYTIRIEAAGTTTYYSNMAYYASGNGGQTNENDMAQLTYTGYYGGQYVVDLKNKQSCGIDFTVTWLQKDTTIYVLGNSTKSIQLPGAPKGLEKIKAKPLYKCGSSGGDMGWVEVETPIALPIKFKSVRTEEIGKDKLKIIFDVEECEGVNVFNVQLQRNWGEFKTVAVIFPDETQPNRQYSVIINL